MNKLITDVNGGFPLTLDDLRYADDALRSSLSRLLAYYSKYNSRFIISGCEMTQNMSSYTINAGLVYYDGEILQVDAHQKTCTPSNTLVLRKATTYDTAGDIILENTDVHRAYQQNRATLNTVATPLANDITPTTPTQHLNAFISRSVMEYMVDNNNDNVNEFIGYQAAKHIFDAGNQSLTNSIGSRAESYLITYTTRDFSDFILDFVATYLENNKGYWKDIPMLNDWHSANSDYRLQYLKTPTGTIHLRGIASHSGVTTFNICQLPAEARPSKDIFIYSLNIIIRSDTGYITPVGEQDGVHLECLTFSSI